MLRILILPFLLLALFAFTTASTLYARDPVPAGTDYQTDVFDPAIASSDVNLQSTVYEVYLSLISSMNRSMFCYTGDGTSTGEWESCTSAEEYNEQHGYPNASATGLIPSLMAYNTQFISQPTISSTEYIASVGEKLKIVQPAYAQGLGYEGLRPVLRVWQAFRNVAYLFATLGFISLAFMVMFRIKAGSQAVISAQAAITKLIFVVIAITFSYAIAGFVVDLIYVFTALLIQLYVSTGLITSTGALEAQNSILGGSVWSTIGLFTGGFWPGDGIGAGSNMQAIVQDIFISVSEDWGTILNSILGEAIHVILRVIIAIAIVYSMFKLFIQLLFAYLQIILLTVLSPLMILPDILPGGNSFMSWLRNIFAHAMIFPVTVFMFITGLVVADVQNATSIVNNTTSTRVNLSLPLFNLPTATLYPLIGIGFILLTPRVNDMVKNAFKVTGSQYMSEIGSNLSAGAAGAGVIASPVTGTGRAVGTQIGRFGFEKAKGFTGSSGFWRGVVEEAENRVLPRRRP